MLKSNLFFLVVFFIINTQLQAQTFKAGVILGVTASQINGDDSAGFNKPGLEGGLKSAVTISEKVDISLEILYSQRGAKDEASADGVVQNIYRKHTSPFQLSTITKTGQQKIITDYIFMGA